jgi:hypothetical protein
MGIESLERELALELDGRFYQNKTLNRLSGMGTLSIFFKS